MPARKSDAGHFRFAAIETATRPVACMKSISGKQKGQLSRATVKTDFQLLTMILPGLICFFLFHYMPLYGILIAFKKYNPNRGIWGSKFVGFKNFNFFFMSQDALRVTRNTVLYAVGFMVIDTLAAVLVAVLLYQVRSRIMTKIYNTVMILPRFL